MNLWKLSALVMFGAITGLCVSYAHSAEQQVKVYKSTAWIGGCSLRAEKIEGSAWNFVATGYSGARFEGYWPLVPGNLSLSVGPKPSRNENLVGVEDPLPEKTLVIKFDHVGGKIRPVRYVFDDVKMRLETNGLIQPKTCPLK